MQTLLYMKNKDNPWEFEWDDDWRRFIHKTRYGNIYGIMIANNGFEVIKPIWIGRYFNDGLSPYWVTAERELRATLIQFKYGQRYYFAK